MGDDPAAAGWQKTLIVLFLGQLFSAVGFSVIFPFLPLYVKDLGAVSGLSIELLAGLVFSAQAFTMMLASPIWGALADRYGRKLMVERAMFGGAVILLLMAFARSAEELVLLRAIQGLVTGTMSAANALAASVAPRQRIGFAMGLLQVGMGSGIALGPLLGGVIADAYGYAAAFYLTAVLLFLAGVLVFWGVKEDFVRQKSERRVGLVGEWRQVLGTAGIPMVYSMRFLSQLGRMVIVPVAPLFIQTLLSDASYLNTFTGLVVGVSSATTTLSAVFLGRLGDRLGHRRVVIGSALAAAALYALQTFVAAGWQLLVLQALVGVAMGGIIPSISALLASLSQADHAGAVYGLDNAIDAGGRSVAPLLGSLVAMSLNLRSVFAVTAVLFLITSLLAFWLPARAQETAPAA
ncbi:MAG: MFS transporter [Anaerolineales bacterium]|nr:MFS transporter [Anaerolineales bacterium]